MTPPAPSLTVKMPQDWASLLFSAAIIVGTLLGVRTLWALNIASSAVVTAFVLGSAIQEPQTQTIGGALLLIVGVVCLRFPSSTRFEQRRVRVVLD